MKIEKDLEKIIQQLLSLFCILKEKKYVLLIFEKFKLQKTNNSLNDSELRKRRLTLSCCKKTTTGTIAIDNVKTQQPFLFFKLPSLFCKKKKKSKLESHEKVKRKEMSKKIFLRICLANSKKQSIRVLSDKMLYVIYADIESLIKKIDNYKNNPEKSSTTKIRKHILWGYSMWTIWIFDHIENKHSLYCRETCMKKCCKSSRKHTKM